MGCLAVVALGAGESTSAAPVGAQNAQTAAPVISVTMTGQPTYFHRHHAEVADVPEVEQAVYQSSWAGEMGLRFTGLQPGAYRVHLAYTEMDMNAPRRRIFDILLNDQVAKREVCIYNAVGNRRVLNLDFSTNAPDGVLTFAQRISAPGADNPSFTLIELYDAAGKLVVRRSAYDMRPPDWEQRDYLDRIYHPPYPNDHQAPPWKGTYKLRADQVAGLTAADVIGPDGIVYPDWTHVGVPGGIPQLANTLSAADFGVLPGSEKDCSTALQHAIDALEARGGGVLFIPAGRYYLDRPVFITGDNCVLRGAGAKLTRLISRFTLRGLAPEFRAIPPDGRVGPSGVIAVWLDPKGITNLTLSAGGTVIKSTPLPGLWENRIQFGFAGRDLLKAVGAGPIELTLSATYLDGTVRSTVQRVTLTEDDFAMEHPPGPLGMINFAATGLGNSPKLLLTADGKRGDLSLRLSPGHGLKAGDRIQIVGPDTARWNQVLRTKIKNGFLRANQYEIAAVHGDRVSIPEPLRIEFPVIDGAYVQRLRPLLHCGIEDLGLEQVVPTFVHGIVFAYGWECWARGLEVVHAGDKALYMPGSKRCEARDCVLDRSWCNDGGSAYVGWESSYDCLMEKVTTYDMRHAPVVQWASSGNVICASVFHGSDAQWHAGWTNENLYEELIVESSQLTGSYGSGGWASGPDDTAHGPNGPRNVVYNCNITSAKTGLWLGGMNEGWLILHNRFVVGRGPAIFAKDASFDHLISDNVFVMLEPQPAAVWLGTPDCTGLEFVGNRFYGPVQTLFGGALPPATDRDNRVRDSGGINRPQPATRSIYEWEQAHREEIWAKQAERAAR